MIAAFRFSRFLISSVLAVTAYGQEPDTRAAEIEKQRAVTSLSPLKPDTDRVEQTMA